MIQLLDFAGVFVFAATGAITASRKQLDIIGFFFLASLTGIGGGTLRDLVLGAAPVFWIQNTNYILVCISSAAIVFFTAHLFESRYRVLLWLDAIGMAAYCVMGAHKGLKMGCSPTGAIVMGVLTATFGGILRDIVAQQPSVLLRRELYVTAALSGSTLYVAGETLELPFFVSSTLGVWVAFLIRWGAIQYGWSLPSYKARLGKTEEELKRDGILPPSR